MRKCFCVGGAHIDISPPVKLMKLCVRHCSEFDHHVRYLKFLHEVRCELRTIRPRSFLPPQLACEQQADRLAQSVAENRQRAEQSLKIAIVVVVAYEQQLQRSIG